MMRRLTALAALLAALPGASACGDPAPARREPVRVDWTGGAERSAPPDPLAEVPGRPPTESERRAMQRLSRIAERIRGLRFEREVPIRVQDRDVITQFVRDQIDEEELERSRVFYVAVGLLPPDLDIAELIVRVLGEQIVGYYDPERGLLVVREDVTTQLDGASASGLGEAEMVVVHELVHALQDQRLALGERYEEERSIDGDNAFAALVEGDATLAMIGHMMETQGQTLRRLTSNPALLRMLIRDNPSGGVQGAEMDSAPPIVRIPLVSRYLDGMLFCAMLHGEAGWRGVDEAHRRTPVSTEQVLHPERYARDERPDPITLPAWPSLEAAGLAPFEEETLGELEMSIYLALGRADARTERDASAAEGWSGDRLRVYRAATGETAAIWFTAWDDAGEAAEAEQAARAAATTASPPERQRVERRGRAVLLVRGLDPALQAPVVQAFEAFAAGLPPEPPRGG